MPKKRSLESAGTVGDYIDAIYSNKPKEEFLGEPKHHYDFTQSEEWANAHGYYPDKRGHRDDRVKKPTHPSHPSRGTWEGNKFILTNKGLADPNYIFFGLNDGGQDPQAIIKYKDTYVIPEVTVTPKGNYINNSYDNIRLHFKEGGNKDNSTYDVVSDVLDFVPIVGGLNRFSRGEYTEGLINLGLDALGPLKYIAKGVKGIRTLANMGKFAKRQKQFTRYQKTIDRIATRAETLSKQGKDYSKEADAIEQLSKKANKVGEKADRYKKAIKDNAISVGGKIIDDLSYTPRIAIASGVHKAMSEDTTQDALLTAFKGAVKDYSYNPEISDPGDAFLLSDSQQKKFMENLGYFKTTDEDGIKKIKKATDALVKFRLGRKLNIYQLGNDQIPRDSVIAIDEEEVPSSILNNYSKSRYLIHAGDNPTIYYRHKNPNKKEYYYREIDLNDYGKHIKQEGTEYGPIQHLANIYDFVGNPFIQKTGITRLDNDNYYQPIIQTNKNNSYKNGGSIHIKPSKRGTFTAAATKHGMGVQEFASKVLRNKDSYSPAMVKKANFARNASKWNH